MYNAPKDFTLQDFSLGWDIVSSPTTMDIRSLRDCKNMNLMLDKSIATRQGMTKLVVAGPVPGYAVKDLFEYPAPNGNTYLLAVANTQLRAYLAGWADIKTVTANKRYNFAIHQNYCYVVNGTDANFKIYNTTPSSLGIAPPAAKPTVADGGAGTLSGKYKYKYCYKRTSPTLTGNPSPESDEITVASKIIDVGVVASTDSKVDKIVIYRTYNYTISDVDPDTYYKVAEIANTTGTYNDQTDDADLGAELELNNGVPPKAKFVIVYKDRVFYANCPDETDGKSLVVYSKMGIGEAVPSDNYEYFDRGDGEAITGMAALPNFLVVFKRNKFAVIVGDFEAKIEIAPTYDIGNIAPWAILQFEDKIIFLSEKGWFAFDGETLYPISEKINLLIESGYISIDQAENYSAAAYSAREQFYYLCNHSAMVKRVFVGHFIIPLLYLDKGLPVSEQKSENIISWTYHQYDSHDLTCMARFTAINGTVRIMAGTSTGDIFELDKGSLDDTSPINFSFETSWFPLNAPASYTKTIRIFNITYSTDQVGDVTFRVYGDFTSLLDEETLLGVDAAYCGSSYCGYAYCGVEGNITEKFPCNCVGNWFRYNLEGNAEQSFSLEAIAAQYRVEGIR